MKVIKDTHKNKDIFNVCVVKKAILYIWRLYILVKFGKENFTGMMGSV